MSDEVRKRAFVGSVGILGEATRIVPEETRAQYAGMEWRKMAGMRDRLIHDYGGVDDAIVRDVAAHKAPDLAARLRAEVDACG